MLERSQTLQDQLSEQIEAMQDQVGVPKSEVEKLKSTLSKCETDLLQAKVELQSTKKRLEVSESDGFSEMQKVTKELANTRTYLQSKEEEVVMLRRQIIEIK